jgi:hypothetical protein
MELISAVAVGTVNERDEPGDIVQAQGDVSEGELLQIVLEAGSVAGIL